jgi:hypothetical protein
VEADVNQTAVNQTWTFQEASARAQGPYTLNLQITGTGLKAPFHWVVTVTGSSGSVLFRIEHDDSSLDALFGHARIPHYIGDCKGYEDCKKKWYFEDLPEEVARAITIEDQSNHPVDRHSHAVLVQEAGPFLREQGLSAERRKDVIDEMLAMRAGRFDSLSLPPDPIVAGPSYMYVPSLGYFVPYWQE